MRTVCHNPWFMRLSCMFRASLLVFAWFLSHHLHLRRKVKKELASDNNVCIGKILMPGVTVVTSFTSECELWASVYRSSNVHNDSNNQMSISVKFMLTFTVWQMDVDGFPDGVFRWEWWWWWGGRTWGITIHMASCWAYVLIIAYFRVTAGFV